MISYRRVARLVPFLACIFYYQAAHADEPDIWDPSISWDDGPCCVPEELDESAKAFEASIDMEDHAVMRRRQFVGELCLHYDCGEPPLTEEQAGRLVDFHDQKEKEYLRLQEAQNERRRSNIGLGIAGLAALFSLIALVQTHIADRRSQAANDRSIRNEEKLLDIEKGNA